MNFYQSPERELSPEEKLLAEVIAANHKIPVGNQIGLPMALDAAIPKIEKLFIEHGLPHREDILSELKKWRVHAEDGLQFSQEADRLMTLVIRVVADTIPKR